MNDILHSLNQALRLIASGDAGLVAIITLSLRVTGLALLLSMLGGVPLGAALGLARVRLRGLVTALRKTPGVWPNPAAVCLLLTLFVLKHLAHRLIR